MTPYCWDDCLLLYNRSPYKSRSCGGHALPPGPSQVGGVPFFFFPRSPWGKCIALTASWHKVQTRGLLTPLSLQSSRRTELTGATRKTKFSPLCCRGLKPAHCREGGKAPSDGRKNVSGMLQAGAPVVPCWPPPDFARKTKKTSPLVDPANTHNKQHT